MECMRTVGSLLVAVLLSVPAAAQRGWIDVKNYYFSVTIPDSGSTIRGMTGLHFERRAPEDSVLTLNLVGMTVDSVLDLYIHNGRMSKQFTYDGRMLRVPLPPTRDPGIDVAIWYHGTPQDGLIIGQSARGRRVVFADNWPERARFWLPT